MTIEPHEGQGRCGARTRSGGCCRKWPIAGRSRCLNHGGRSTGPRTAEGKSISRQNSLKHGLYSAEFKDAMRLSRELLREFEVTLP